MMYFGLCLLFFCYCFDQQDSDDEETVVNMTLNLNRGPRDRRSFQTYIPEDFANFEDYNATLESQDGFRSDLKGSRCGGGEREVSRSPTASSCTSGYFSQSASNATLSDMPFSTSESSDHLSCTSRDSQDPPGCPAGRGYTQTKSVSAGNDTQQPPLSADLLINSASSPVNIPNCTEKQDSFPLPHNSVLSTSLEFTDFKGADDSIRECDLAHFTERWEQEGLEISADQQLKLDRVETCDTDNQLFSDVSRKTSSPENAICKGPNYEDPVHIALPFPNTGCTPIKSPISLSGKAPDPSSAIIIPSPSVPRPTSPSVVKSLVTAPSSAPAPRAGGEPPIQEPAQGDLPHGSPCPSPNPGT